jgi:DNA repair and recombination protein RAD52
MPATTVPSAYCERASFSSSELSSIESALRRRLGPDFVSTRPSGNGVQVAYIEGWKAVQLANDIFGFNNWSHSVTSSSIDFVDYNQVFLLSFVAVLLLKVQVF